MSLHKSLIKQLAKGAAFLLALASCSYGLGQGLTYVEAVRGGILGGTPNLSPQSDIVDIDAFTNDDLWGLREFGSGGIVIVAGDSAVAPEPAEQVFVENAPEITQTITGLSSGTSYDIYAVYWSAINANWAIRAGLSSDPGANPIFSRTGADVGGNASTAGTFAGSAIWDVLPAANNDPGLFTENGETINMHVARVGTATAVGGEVQVFIDDVSTEEIEGTDFNRSWFDGLAFVPAGVGVTVDASIDQDTGDISIDYTSITSLEVTGYSIRSAFGTLDPTGWNSIATGSNSSLDPNDTWTESVSTASELTESETAGSDGFDFNGSVSLGNAWSRSPYQDVVVSLTLADSTVLEIAPTFTGTAVTFGSFDDDGDIDLDDYAVLASNLFTDVSNLTVSQAYFLGDLNQDLVIDYTDFTAFRSFFDGANGAGAFAAAFAIPEPTGFGLLSLCLVAIGARRRNRHHSAPNSTDDMHHDLTSARASQLPTKPAVGLVVAFTGLVFTTLVSTSPANAVPVENWFISNDIPGPDIPGVDNLTGGDTNSPTIGDGSANSANNIEYFGTFSPLSINPGEQILLTGSASFTGIGTAAQQFRFGLFDRNGTTGGNTQGWSGFLALNASGGGAGEIISKEPAPAVFATTGAGLVSRQLENEPNGNLFDDDTYDFSLAVSRIDTTTLSVDVSLTSVLGAAEYDFSINDFIETDPLATPFSYNAAGFLNGGSLAADQVTFSDVEVFVQEIPALTLTVDTTDGTASLTNPFPEAVAIDFYQVESASGSLDTAGWQSLDDADGADAPGAGWVEAGGSNANIAGEGNVEASLELAPGETLYLGSLFSSGAAEDLTISYGVSGEGSLTTGNVNYVADDSLAPNFLQGDFNGDGQVNTADYAVWRNALGTSQTLPNDITIGRVAAEDYDTWLANVGRTALGVPNVAVPEPSSLGILLASAVGWIRRTR